MGLEFLLLWATMALSLLYYYMAVIRRRRHRLSGSAGRLPPGPRPLPVVGNLFDLRGANLHHTLARHARAHGPVMCFEVVSATRPPLVVVSSAAAAREAYTRHDRRFAARAVPDAARARGWAGRSVAWLPSASPRWRAVRAVMAAHATSPRALAAARGARERKARDVVARLRASAGRPVRLRPLLYRCMLNLLSSSLFSVDVSAGDGGDSSQPGLAEDLHRVAEAIMKPNVSDVLPFLSALDLQGRRRVLGRHIEKVFRTLDNIIDTRLAAMAITSPSSEQNKHDGDGKDFLDTLLNLMSAGETTRDDVTNILFEVFGAGGETVATTVEWAMAELLRHPATMAKARAEVAGALGKKEIIEESDAARLPYVQAVLRESMRLHPVVPLLCHQVVDDGVDIAGYAVPKGSSFIINSWAVMRDPAVWDRPDEFRPERFIVAEDDNPAVEAKHVGKDRYEFIPFGSGRRSCPGVPIVERVLPVILASLLRAFEWRLPDGVSAEQLDVSESFGTVTCMAVPLQAVPIMLQ